MLLIAIVFVILILYKGKIAKSGTFQEDYCAPGKTNALKGVFVLAVFLSHMQTYITIPKADQLPFTVVGLLGQLMVVPFLFYSGYGVMESIKKKGFSYVRRMPIQRLARTLLHFDLAVLLFLAVRYLTGEPVTLGQLLLALVGIKSIGNSNWYVFVILLVYGITALSFTVFRKNNYIAAALATLLGVLAVLAMSRLCKLYWHDTLLCYILGLWFSLLRKPLEKVFLRNDLIWLAWFLVAAVGLVFLWLQFQLFPFVPHLLSLVFAVFLVLFSAKVSLDNFFLQFLGKYTFWLYILQRLPMILMEHFGICTASPASFFLASFAVTCILAVAFDAVLQKLDRRLFPRS